MWLQKQGNKWQERRREAGSGRGKEKYCSAQRLWCLGPGQSSSGKMGCRKKRDGGAGWGGGTAVPPPFYREDLCEPPQSARAVRLPPMSSPGPAAVIHIPLGTYVSLQLPHLCSAQRSQLTPLLRISTPTSPSCAPGKCPDHSLHTGFPWLAQTVHLLSANAY